VAVLGVIVCASLANHGARADESRAALVPIAIADMRRTPPVSFEDEILPILAKNCLACHKSGSSESELVLETPDSVRKGDGHGPALVPGRSAESRLLIHAAHQKEPPMPPPDNKVGAAALSPEQLGLIKLWIDQGAQGKSGAIARVIERRPLAPSLRPIMALAISPDDDLVACSRGEKLAIYDLRGPRLVEELADPSLATGGRAEAANEDLIRSLAFDHQGDRLASGGFRTVKIWKRPRTSLEKELTLSDQPKVATVSSDGRWFALGYPSGAVELRELAGDQTAKALGKHDGAVTALVFSTDGARLYTAGADRTIRSWELGTAKESGKLATPAEPRAIALVASGEQLASGDADNVIRIWPISAVSAKKTDKPVTPARELKGHSQTITCVAAFSTSGERLLSGSDDGRAILWKVADGQNLRQFDHGGPIAALAAQPDGKRILTAGKNGITRLWNPDDGAAIAEIKEDPAAARAVARGEASQQYANHCVEYRKEELRDAQENVKRETTALEEANKAKTMDEKAVKDKTVAADKAVAARTAAAAKADEATATLKTAREKKDAAQKSFETSETTLRDATSAAEKAKQAAEGKKDDKDLAAARDAAEKRLADARAARQAAETALNQAVMQFGDAERRSEEARRAANEARDKARDPERELQEAKATLAGRISFIATATTVVERAKAAVPPLEQAVAKAEATVKEREADRKRLGDAAQATIKPLAAAAFSTDGRYVAIGGEVPGVRLYDAERGAPVESLDTHAAAVIALAVAGDGRLLGIDAAKRATTWRLAGHWTLERTIGRPDEPAQLVDRVLALDFSPDGKLLATGGGMSARSGELKIWNVADGSLAREIAGAHRDTVFGVRFSPDGQYLATASADRLAKVFRVSDGSLVRTFKGHTHHVLGVAWRPDGKLLATGGGDRVVKLWDFDTGAPLKTMRGDTYQIGEYKGEITSISFIGDTEHLIASSGDHTVRMHRTSSTRDVRCYKDGAFFMHAAVATSDGRFIVGGGRDGVLHIWNGENTYAVQFTDPLSPQPSRGESAKK
jgi:WD40 repeat protein